MRDKLLQTVLHDAQYARHRPFRRVGLDLWGWPEELRGWVGFRTCLGGVYGFVFLLGIHSHFLGGLLKSCYIVVLNLNLARIRRLSVRIAQIGGLLVVMGVGGTWSATQRLLLVKESGLRRGADLIRGDLGVQLGQQLSCHTVALVLMIKWDSGLVIFH